MNPLFFLFLPAAAALLFTAIGCGRDTQPATKNGPVTTFSETPDPAVRTNRQALNSDAPADLGEIPVWVGKSKDEPFDVTQFLTARSVPVDNSAPLYQSALAHISPVLGGERAAPLEERIRNLPGIQKLTPGAISEVEQVLAAAELTIKGIDAAQAKPDCVFVTGLSADARMAHAQASRTFVKLSLLQILVARTKGDFELAEAAIRRCLRLSRDLRPRGQFVCQMASVANDGSLFSSIERLTLRDPHLTAEQCDRLLALLVEHERKGIDRYQEGLRMDYILARCSIHDLQTGRLTLDQIFDLLSGHDDDKPSSIGSIALNYEAETAACNRLFAILFDAAENSSPGPDEFAAFHHEIAKLKNGWESFKAKVAITNSPMRPTLLSEMPAMQFYTWTASVRPGHEASRRAAAGLAGLQMLIALRRYEHAHRRSPTTLAEAAAETILKTVPTDPYSGHPLRLTLVADKPTIYSVGKDFKDDGGQSDWNFGTQPGDYLFVLSPPGE